MPRKLLSRSEGSVAKKLNATVQQSNFLGGEASPAAQGRTDDPRFKTWLSSYKNAYPTEQGAWTRRDGSQGIIPTNSQNYAKLLSMETTAQLPYCLEFSDNSLRFFYAGTPCFTADARVATTISPGAGALLITTDAAHGWSVGDDVMVFLPPNNPPANEAAIRGAVLRITIVNSATQFTVGDEVGNQSIFTAGFVGTGLESVWRIQRKTTVINSTNYPSTLTTVISQLRAIQTDTSALIVQGQLPPQVVTVATPSVGNFDAQFAIAPVTFQDGPYASILVDTGTVSALSGSGVTFTPRSGSYTFTADDVGKQIRLFSEPANWASGTTYASGALIKYNGAYYQSTQGSNTGNTPGSPNVVSGVLTQWWVAVLNVQRWVWGTVQSQTGTACVLNFGTDLSNLNGLPVGATNAIPSGNGTGSITSWQLGLWSPGLGYPINGCFHEGRLCLTGPIGNRFDMSVSNQAFTFSPTDQYGNVNDNSAISYILNTADQMYWMKPDDRGIICGAQRGEWLVSGGTEGDPLTPTNCKARRVTKFRCAAIEPVEVDHSLLFTQFYKQHLYEYLVDSFSNRFTGKALNEIDMPVTAPYIAELAATLEPTPRVWMRMQDGSLATCTYRRVSRFITEPAQFDAINPHSIGDARVVEAMLGVSNPGLAGDAACNALLDPSIPLGDLTSNGDFLYLVTNDTVGRGQRMVEIIRPQREADDYALGWYADQVPGAGKHIVSSTVDGTDAICYPIGGLIGADTVTAPADLANRAVATPGIANPIPASGATRSADLAILNNAVYFNGSTALSGLPNPGEVHSFSMSVWLNINGDNAANGSFTGPSDPVFGQSTGVPTLGALLSAMPVYRGANPITFEVEDFAATKIAQLPGNWDPTLFKTVKVTGPQFKSDGTQWLAPGATAYYKMAILPTVLKKESLPGTPTWVGMQILPAVAYVTDPLGITGHDGNNSLFTMGTVDSVFLSTPTVGTSAQIDGKSVFNTDNQFLSAPLIPPSNNGWFHLMLSINQVLAGGHYQLFLTTVVNDTVLINNDALGTYLPTFADPLPLAKLLSTLCIGGACTFPAGSPDGTEHTTANTVNRPETNGLFSGMTELWMSTTFVDWTVAATRYKFHNKDNLNSIFAPTDLGATGNAPGVTPFLYCTGPTALFHKNRAKKNAPLSVWNPSASSGTHLGPNDKQETAYVDAWLGAPVK